MKAEHQVFRSETHQLRLTGEDICELLRGARYDVPTNARVTFLVPGGGDWSHLHVTVDRDTPLTVQWEVKA